MLCTLFTVINTVSIDNLDSQTILMGIHIDCNVPGIFTVDNMTHLLRQAFVVMIKILCIYSTPENY